MLLLVSTAGNLFLNFSKNGRRGVAGASAEATFGGTSGGETTRSRRLETLMGLVGDEAIRAAGVVGVMLGDMRALGEGGSASGPARMGDFWE